MTTGRWIVFGGMALCLVTSASRASGQEVTTTPSVKLVNDVRAGVASSQGRGLGLAAAASFGLSVPRWSTEFRLEGLFGTWQQMEARLGTAGVAVMRNLPMRAPGVVPYVVAGGGIYAARGHSAGLGGSAGLGAHVDVLGARTFAEVRVHSWFESVPGGSHAHRMTPLLLGVSF